MLRCATRELLVRGARRTPLTSKDGGRKYYKGSQTGSMGAVTSYGKFVVDAYKIRCYVAPEMTNETVCAFIQNAWSRLIGSS